MVKVGIMRSMQLLKQCSICRVGGFNPPLDEYDLLTGGQELWSGWGSSSTPRPVPAGATPI